ncbi:MAG: ferrous iron transport protein A [Tissierellales bacterium]|jgi:ferrous iron transport protein A|nr:ferrous iron transport protein A [Tissierellales bacterium]
MENILEQKMVVGGNYQTESQHVGANDLTQADVDRQYTIRSIETGDEELKDFLFTLGCYEGEEITLISILADNYVVTVKDARYSIDTELARAIII